MKKSEQEREKFKTLTEKSNASLHESVEAMKNFRRDLDKQMDDLEMAFANEVRKVSQNTYMNMREIDSTCDNVIKYTKNVLKDIKVLNETKQGNKLFQKLILARQTMKTNVNLLESKLKGTDFQLLNLSRTRRLSVYLCRKMRLGSLLN
jgi:wobble nucleotide-excising tRNase